MTMSELKEYARKQLEKNDSIKLMIVMPGFESPEIIINPPENIEKKLEYYENTYDENCQHRTVEGLYIKAYVL